ncbi:MAG: hypothetical protein ABTQ25_15175 [Nitrosomonas ureae]|jgi:predicted nucleic acid-binding Zn ribbon protein
MTISTSEAGKRLADARPKREQSCAVCGKVFTTMGRGTYCSNACRQKAKYARKRTEGS